MKKRIIHIVFLCALLYIGYLGFKFYSYTFKSNVNSKEENNYLLIPPGTNFKELTVLLKSSQLLKNLESFEWLASKKGNFKENIKSGKFLIKKGMSNNQIINLLRIGSKEIVNVTFNNIRTIEELSSKITNRLLCDSASFYKVLTDKNTYKKYQLNEHTIKTIFLPDTYEFFWDITPQKIIQKMFEEYTKFWNKKNRIQKAQELNLTKSEIITLASIVEQEQLKFIEEYPTIAGLYINRLRKKIPLQSDPTLKYALKSFNIKRILNNDKKVNSPYNTYKHNGLPPGPISIPSKNAIDAVLNYKKHNFYYMCSKADLSGYHDFSKNLKQHTRLAIKYRNALDKLKITR